MTSKRSFTKEEASKNYTEGSSDLQTRKKFWKLFLGELDMNQEIITIISNECNEQPREEPMQLVDIACGNGDLLQNIARLKWGLMTGVDVSEKMLEEARAINQTKNFDFVLCDMNELYAHWENMFDIAICKSGLHHSTDPVGAIRQAFHILKPGGLYIIVLPLRRDKQMVMDYMSEVCKILRREMPFMMRDPLFRLEEAHSAIQDLNDENGDLLFSEIHEYLFVSCLDVNKHMPSFWEYLKTFRTALEPEVGEQQFDDALSEVFDDVFERKIRKVLTEEATPLLEWHRIGILAARKKRL